MEPICSSPDRISGQRISDLADAELACLPQLSPTSSYEETIQGKNISLVCSVNSIPPSRVTWRYRGLLVNNGSTMVSDIDLRTYYYTNTLVGPGLVRSELVLSRTSVDDTGAFQCVAENRAGVAIGNFTVSVVTPVPPEPPKEMVEERFQQEHFVAICVAAVVICLMTIITAMVFFIKCHRRRRRDSSDSGGKVTGSRLTCSTIAAGSGSSSKAGSAAHLYECPASSKSSHSFTSDKLLMAVHRAENSSSSSSLLLKSGRVMEGAGGGGSLDFSLMEDDGELGVPADVYDRLMDNQLPPHAPSEPAAARQRGSKGSQKRDSLSGAAPVSPVHKFNHILVVDHNSSTYHQIQPAHPPPAADETFPGASGGRKASLTTSYSLYEEAVVDQLPVAGGLITAAAQKSAKLVPSHWHFSTLPKKKLLLVAAEQFAGSRGEDGRVERTSAAAATALGLDRQSSVRAAAGAAEIILPPPPQFKGVHFEPDVLLDGGGGCGGLVLEGLPEFPALPRRGEREERARIDI
jgi:hypothetical protein